MGIKWRQALWFALLWLAGVGVLALAAYLLRRLVDFAR